MEVHSAAASDRIEEDTYMTGADVEGVSDSGDFDISDFNESHFGDTESNGDLDHSGQQSPTASSDIGDVANCAEPGDDGDTLVEAETGTDSDSPAVPPVRRVYRQTMIYSDSTDDENNREPLTNGVHGESSATGHGFQQPQAIVYSDITDDQNDGEPLVNGVHGEPSATGHGFQQHDIVYSDITDDENDGEPLVNGVHGEGGSSATGPSDTHAGGTAARHTQPRSQQTTSGETNREVSGRAENHNDNSQSPGNGRPGIRPDEAPTHSVTVSQEQNLDEDVLGDIRRTLSDNDHRRMEDLFDPYSDTDIGDRYFMEQSTGDPVFRNTSMASAFQPFSSDFYNDPVDWDDDEERMRLATINALASYMRPFTMSDMSFAEKENVPPTHAPSSFPGGQGHPEQHLLPGSRYSHESRSEHYPYSFGPLRPVPTYPMPSQNISSHSPVTTAHIWYRHIGRDIESIPEQRTFVNGVVRPVDEPQMGFGDMGM